MTELTEREKFILVAIHHVWRHRGSVPTRRELATRMAVHINSVQVAMRSLAVKGFLRIESGKARGVTLTERGKAFVHLPGEFVYFRYEEGAFLFVAYTSDLIIEPRTACAPVVLKRTKQRKG